MSVSATEVRGRGHDRVELVSSGRDAVVGVRCIVVLEGCLEGRGCRVLLRKDRLQLFSLGNRAPCRLLGLDRWRRLGAGDFELWGYPVEERVGVFSFAVGFTEADVAYVGILR